LARYLVTSFARSMHADGTGPKASGPALFPR
jgi:hypothetical protein